LLESKAAGNGFRYTGGNGCSEEELINLIQEKGVVDFLCATLEILDQYQKESLKIGITHGKGFRDL